ncbi:hypothetical protein DFH27DRAFT_369038 [Peziza echinospora]|nr:hypothetical protein DFH27DRAFT_369038 [Peziza echinospora]
MFFVFVCFFSFSQANSRVHVPVFFSLFHSPLSGPPPILFFLAFQIYTSIPSAVRKKFRALSYFLFFFFFGLVWFGFWFLFGLDVMIIYRSYHTYITSKRYLPKK